MVGMSGSSSGCVRSLMYPLSSSGSCRLEITSIVGAVRLYSRCAVRSTLIPDSGKSQTFNTSRLAAIRTATTIAPRRMGAASAPLLQRFVSSDTTFSARNRDATEP